MGETTAAARKVLLTTVFLDLLGFGIVVPFFPYFAKACGAGGTAVGLVGSAYSLLQFLMAPFWGRLSDRIGRRPVIRGAAGWVAPRRPRTGLHHAAVVPQVPPRPACAGVLRAGRVAKEAGAPPAGS